MAEVSGWDIAVLLAKAIAYAATFGAAGGVFFLWYNGALIADTALLRIRRMIRILVIASAVASLCAIPLLAGSMGGDVSAMVDGSFAGMIIRAGQGRAIGIRIAGLALMVFARSGTPHRSRLLGVLGAVVAATSFAWMGHVHALEPDTLPSLILGLHLLCAAFWLGALAPLLIVARNGSTAEIAMAAARFGKLALGAVALLLLAGSGLLWILIRDASAFWSSAYGRLFILKLLAVAFLLSAAALNKLSLTPKLSIGDPAAVISLRRSLKAEMILGGLILLITAAFTTVAGPP